MSNHPTRKQIIDTITAYYLLSQSEIDSLADSIYDALRAAMIAAYRYAAHWIGKALEWLPSKAQEKALEDLASERAKQIATTYERDILRASTTYLDAFEKANGTLEGVLAPLRQTLTEYTDARTQQKAEQISEYEVSEGANSGTETLIDDVINSDEGDTVYVSEEDMANIFVGVVPETSAGIDFCEEFAGEMWPLLEATDIPEFPAHQNCPHRKELFDMREAA